MRYGEFEIWFIDKALRRRRVAIALQHSRFGWYALGVLGGGRVR